MIARRDASEVVTLLEAESGNGRGQGLGGGGREIGDKASEVSFLQDEQVLGISRSTEPTHPNSWCRPRTC